MVGLLGFLGVWAYIDFGSQGKGLRGFRFPALRDPVLESAKGGGVRGQKMGGRGGQQKSEAMNFKP